MFEKLMNPWAIVGFVGQIVFGLRFLVQWIVSEKKKESVIPESFWYLSIVGSMLVLIYAFTQMDPVFIIGYALNSIVYIRNIMLIEKKKKQAA
ncbi:MAG: lipid-A-disaccharide synthase N-terminal domain-containing protein [Planctomycetes bacterium]|nr:lipid-A-disaccharide synthase N-terminal domain-containing protein [Planctomycetota bacterium]